MGSAGGEGTSGDASKPAAHRAASPSPVTERGRRTRAALVQAAGRVFAERGYHDATIGDIMQQMAHALSTPFDSGAGGTR